MTTLRLGDDVTLAAVSMPDLQAEPEVGHGWARFTQTAGGRTGAPMPRPVRRAPFVQYRAPVAWTTLELTLYADGRARGPPGRRVDVPPPLAVRQRGRVGGQERHDRLEGVGGKAFGKGTPWGDEDSPAFVTEVETALERELAGLVMRGAAKPKIRSSATGEVSRARVTR